MQRTFETKVEISPCKWHVVTGTVVGEDRLSVTDQAYHQIAKSAAKHVKSPVTTTSAGKTIPLDDEPGFDAFNR